MKAYRLRAYTFLLIATIIWSFAGIVIKYTLNHIDPYSFLTYRFFISGSIALILVGLGKIKIPSMGLLIQILLIGLLGNVIALGFLFVGLTKTSVIESSVIEALAPMVNSIMGVYFLKEIITKKEKRGMYLALLGTIITIIGPAISVGAFGAAYTFDNVLGNLMIVLFVITDSHSFIIAKKLLRQRVSPMAIANLSFISGFLGILPLMIYFEGYPYFRNTVLTMPAIAHWGVWYMAIFSGTLAYGFWNIGQKTIEVSEASMFRYLIPVFTTPLAIIILSEQITIHFVIGAILILWGVILSEFKESFKKLDYRSII